MRCIPEIKQEIKARNGMEGSQDLLEPANWKVLRKNPQSILTPFFIIAIRQMWFFAIAPLLTDVSNISTILLYSRFVFDLLSSLVAPFTDSSANCVLSCSKSTSYRSFFVVVSFTASEESKSKDSRFKKSMMELFFCLSFRLWYRFDGQIVLLTAESIFCRNKHLFFWTVLFSRGRLGQVNKQRGLTWSNYSLKSKLTSQSSFCLVIKWRHLCTERLHS